MYFEIEADDWAEDRRIVMVKWDEDLEDEGGILLRRIGLRVIDAGSWGSLLGKGD